MYENPSSSIHSISKAGFLFLLLLFPTCWSDPNGTNRPALLALLLTHTAGSTVAPLRSSLSLSLSRWVHVRLHERILNGPRGPWSVPVRYSQAITTIGYTPIKPGASRDLLAMHRVQVSWKAVRVAKRLSWKSCPFFLRFFSLSRSLSLALALCLPSRDVSHSNCSVSTRHEARPRSVFLLSLSPSFFPSFLFLLLREDKRTVRRIVRQRNELVINTRIISRCYVPSIFILLA